MYTAKGEKTRLYYMPSRSVNESFKKLFITTAECSTQLTNLSPPLPSPFRPQNYTSCDRQCSYAL